MQNFLFIRNGKEYFKLDFSDIVYVEASKNYVCFVTLKRKHLMRTSMKCIEAILPSGQFCRIHKSYIISLQFMSGFNLEEVHVLQTHLPIGDQYKKSFKNQVMALGNDRDRLS